MPFNFDKESAFIIGRFGRQSHFLWNWGNRETQKSFRGKSRE